MDPNLLGILNALQAIGFTAHQAVMQQQTTQAVAAAQRQNDQAAAAAQRQADQANVVAQMVGLDHRMITTWAAQQLASAGTGDLNTISHIPTAQPFTAPNVVNPQGGPPASTPKTA